MSKNIQIDLKNEIMSKIINEGIEIKSSQSIKVAKFIKYGFTALAGFGLFISLFGISVILNTQTIGEFLSYGKDGAVLFIKTLPWFGIVLATGSLYILARHLKGRDISAFNKQIPATLLILVLTISGLGLGFVAPDNSKIPDTLAKLSHFGTDKQLEIDGFVEEIGPEYILVKDSNQEIIKVFIKSDTRFEGNEFKVGSYIMALGVSKDGGAEAFVIKTLQDPVEIPEIKVESTEKKVKTEKKKAKPEETEVVKPEEEPVAVEPKKESTTPKKKKETEEPTPSEPSKVISLTLVTNPPEKAKFSWTSNFSPDTGYKLIWSTSPNPTYPAMGYEFYPGGSTSGLGALFQSDLGSGTFYVKVCAYHEGSCQTHSNQVVINFGP